MAKHLTAKVIQATDGATLQTNLNEFLGSQRLTAEDVFLIKQSAVVWGSNFTSYLITIWYLD